MSMNVKVILLGTVVFLALPLSARAAEEGTPKVDVDTGVTLQYLSEESMDLGTRSEDHEDSFSQQFWVRARTDFTEDLEGFFHGRALNIEGDTGFDDDTGESIASDDDSFLELRELYLRKENLFGRTPMALQVGRQRLREPRTFWWNSDNDLVKLSYDTTLWTNFIALGEDMHSYRAGSDSDYQEDDEDRFRILGETSRQYKLNHFLEGRFVYENDHSDLEAPGTILETDDRDAEDQELVWLGVRATGSVQAPVQNVSALKYRADVIGLFGEEDLLTTAAGPGGDQVTVTGSDNRDVRAWAFDGSVIVTPDIIGSPAITLGYAYGSGDDDDGGTDNEFRQTDLQGNSSRNLGLERGQQRIYGEVLRPELSNLHVVTAGVDVPVTEATDVSLTYFNYHLDEEATSLRSDGISAAMNGDDTSVGQAADFIVNVDVLQQFQKQSQYVDDVDFRFIVGSFFPGDAFEPEGDNEAFRVLSELKFRF